MKILILQDYLRIGGTERQSIFLAKFFQEQGHTVQMLLFRPGGHLANESNLKDLNTQVLQKFDSHLPLWAPGLMGSIRRFNPEIILCMGRTANCYAGFVQNRFPEIKVVGTLRTGKTLFPLHRWSLGKVNSVLVNSNWWKRRLLEHNFPEKRIHVVHNAVLLERSEAEKDTLRTRFRDQYSLRDNTTLFLNVSTFRPGKRHQDLLRIFAELRESRPELDWRLWLVGDGKLYNRCKRWVAENGLGTRIRFFHYQNDPFPFYAAADVAVSTSQEDSLPNFLIEAQAAGLPIVAYDCRGVAECCQPERTGIIHPPRSPNEFRHSLIQLMENRSVRTRFGDEARTFAKERFSPIPQARETLRFLESLI